MKFLALCLSMWSLVFLASLGTGCSDSSGKPTRDPAIGGGGGDLGIGGGGGDLGIGGIGGDEGGDHFARVEFIVDDSANQTYSSESGLAWKGSFSVLGDILNFDPGWNGPFPMLYDDGPWDAEGHEPAGAIAGDHIWGTSLRTPSPEMNRNFEFGLIRGSVNGSDGQWIWEGANGIFTVAADSTDVIQAGSYTIEPFGNIDMRIMLDINDLNVEYLGFDEANGVNIKSSAWGWSEIPMSDDGSMGDETADDQIFTFVLSINVGEQTDYPHTGLLSNGDEAGFVLVLGEIEYKVGGIASTDGVSASTKLPGDDWRDAPVQNANSGDMNTYITAP